MSHLRIYLASSWKNAQAVRIILDCLRRDGLEVDCFCDQEGGRVGFNIRDCLEKLGGDINGIDAITAFEHPGFCSVCVARVSEASYPPRRIITSRRFFIEDREGGKNYGRND